VLLNTAIERLYDLNVGITPVEEGSPHERPHKPLLLLAVFDLLDGEAVGDTFHAFDLLEVKGHDVRNQAYLQRYSGLLTLLPHDNPSLQWVGTDIQPEDKLATYGQLLREGKEGVVLKRIDAPFSPGRPNSGGSQLKFKFVETASFVVTGINRQRSVTLGLYGTGKASLAPQPAGNVTIPPNQPIPRIGAVAEVRYLYAYRESGSIYQPVYLGERDDIPDTDCSTTQLKYKAEPIAA